jgi:hypothetical protein
LSNVSSSSGKAKAGMDNIVKQPWVVHSNFSAAHQQLLDIQAGAKAAQDAMGRATAPVYAIRLDFSQVLGAQLAVATLNNNLSGIKASLGAARALATSAAQSASNAAASFPGHAAGIMGAPAGYAWVGEKGPELMYLPRGSNIYPNAQSMAMASGVGSKTTEINISVDARGSSNPEATKMQAKSGVQAVLPQLVHQLNR